jgi:hypothetical protein
MVGTVMSRMITYLGPDSARINHAMKVYGFATALWEEEAIARGLSEEDERKETLLLAAILHDIGVLEAERKHQSNEGHYQEMEGPAIAEEILSSCDIDPRIRGRVCYLIGHHHSYHLIDDLDFQILCEAEELVNLEEEQIDLHTILAARKISMRTAGAVKILDSYLLCSHSPETISLCASSM